MNLLCKLWRHKWSPWDKLSGVGGPNAISQKICLRNNCTAIEQKFSPRRQSKQRYNYGPFTILYKRPRHTTRRRFYD